MISVTVVIIIIIVLSSLLFIFHSYLDVVLRDKHGLHYNSKQAEGNLSVVRRRKTKTREEWLHGVILKVDVR